MGNFWYQKGATGPDKIKNQMNAAVAGYPGGARAGGKGGNKGQNGLRVRLAQVQTTYSHRDCC